MKEQLDIETYREAAELRRIGNRAVRKAQAENRRLGIPNAYSHQGRLYYELPNSELTEEDPFEEGMHNARINTDEGPNGSVA